MALFYGRSMAVPGQDLLFGRGGMPSNVGMRPFLRRGFRAIPAAGGGATPDVARDLELGDLAAGAQAPGGGNEVPESLTSPFRFARRPGGAQQMPAPSEPSSGGPETDLSNPLTALRLGRTGLGVVRGLGDLFERATAAPTGPRDEAAFQEQRAGERALFGPAPEGPISVPASDIVPGANFTPNYSPFDPARPGSVPTDARPAPPAPTSAEAASASNATSAAAPAPGTATPTPTPGAAPRGTGFELGDLSAVGTGLSVVGGALSIAGTAAGNPDVANAGKATGAAGSVASKASGVASEWSGPVSAVARLGTGAFDISQMKNASSEEKAAMAAHNIGLAAADYWTGGLAELGPLIGNAIGSDNIVGQMLLGYPGLAHGDDEARIKRDMANVRNVLGAKVPAAMSRLNQTLADASGVDAARATTDDLLALTRNLQVARQEFNAVDHAFKGGLTVNGKPIKTGLSLGQVQPALDALNLSQLRIQDELERRSVPSASIPGRQSPLDWLNFIAPRLYDSVRGIDGNALKNYASYPAYYGLDANDPVLSMVRELQAIPPGRTEAGLRAVVAAHPTPPPMSPGLRRLLQGENNTGPAGLYDYVGAQLAGGGGE